MLYLLKENAKPAQQYKKRKTYPLLGTLSQFTEQQKASQDSVQKPPQYQQQ